jgi:hypothetical protein
MRRDRGTTHPSSDNGEESKRELESEGRRCGSDWESLGVYIWAEGAPERR